MRHKAFAAVELGKDVSDASINGKPANSSQTRLKSALPPQVDPGPPPVMVDNPYYGPIHESGSTKTAYNPGKTPPVQKKWDL